ncbi:bifunctional tetrahydrofolate synthase/dihydrofolate synthase [Bordetella avium]|uniref:bifunctional tetrahydrofolate synthase/dihydrofolate synthase n=1 Tax=Bordetella avium TaxID=521 RepID=UPI000E0AB127|nr:bifunctional tetrahydrofolate synthase/dihydrofolate synthase [Bordetella avium]RIQ12250.1 bifunctional tetrahydrofolate synthase/dihydrofolate synthase [Bordetella avium]RIQ35968.1 bifunctional tetrahydrofolate synthase/dihydrofolate synthase [Bordetella avium]RIQ40204.1 bifunctional tetrahydrofolate synthase/dihydrofolate synthase [Bordetella avium]RIQ41633.1 bifunctional tetrahydrofolate synthase/dihydrofolate synthase [Bordetella avium]RIQ47521.1 bifunctional tetrahydrofolate synthase/d
MPSRPDATAGLADWLQYLESLHSKAIDLGLERVKAVAGRLDLQLNAVTFTVGGTNGKGSTCAMLEATLLAAGYRVGLYTSPHLIDFNERARVNGEIVSDAALLEQFQAIEAARGDTSLTYFEFTTLAILRLFAQASLDAVVLEVGLGGRLDAVNIIDADCAIVTSVDLDHMDYLGDTREKIGFEKAHIFRSGRPAICSDPVPPQSLIDYAEAIGADLWLFGRDFNYSGDRQQWSYGGREVRRNSLAYPALRGANQLLNASAALAALESVRQRLPVPQQAVRLGLLQASLPGRFQILPGQPIIILDVAHNPHAAAVLAQNLDNMGFHPYTHAVFGMLNDKDLPGVIAKIGSRIDHWYCAGLPGPRGSDGASLAQRVEQALPPSPAGVDAPTVTGYDDSAQAFAAAREKAGEGDRIVVFGSFLTVAGVLQALGRKA